MSQASAAETPQATKVWAIRFLLFIAGLGGLLYGIDVGIIGGALPYLQATSGMTANQLSAVVAAVLLGGVFSTLFAGLLADWMGRKKLMALSGLLFVISIPMIALAQGYTPLILGRLLQGISAGLIGVVVPLYLAECLSASSRGKGTGIFQWLLTLGIFIAAIIGFYFSLRVDQVEKLHNAAKLFAFKDVAWRSIFWVSLPPGVLFVLGALLVAESPRWLFRRGNKDAARKALLFSRSAEQADLELREMEETAAAEQAARSSGGEKVRESLLHRKYVIPFLIACVILACNQATGINSIIQYNATILIQAGLSDKAAHVGYVAFTLVNFLMTIGGVVLVDRKGRKFLLSIGSAGIVVSLAGVGFVFHQTEQLRVDCRAAVQDMIGDYRDVSVAFEKSATDRQAKDFTFSFPDRLLADSGVDQESGQVGLAFKQPVAAARLVKDEKENCLKLQVTLAGKSDADNKWSAAVDETVVTGVTAADDKVILTVAPRVAEVKVGDKYPMVSLPFNQALADKLLASAGDAGKTLVGKRATLTVIYGCGDFVAATNAVRSDDDTAKPVEIKPKGCLPGSSVEAFLKNPFASFAQAKAAPLRIENALITPVPDEFSGWLTVALIYVFCAFYAVGPGVCVWLALSELMPTRIRSNGMSIALLLNIAVSTVIAGVFLPTVGKYGYATMFFAFAAFTIIYFITAAFFLPETKGRTLEEIEEHFSGHKMKD